MKSIFYAAAASIALFAAPAAAQNIQGMGILALDPVDDGNTVLTMSGEGSVTRAPDVAVFAAGVTTVAPTAEQALRENAATMAKLVAAAKRMGIADKDMQTSDISIRPIMSDEDEYGGVAYAMSDVESDVALVVEAAAEAVVDAADYVSTPSARQKQPPRILGYRATNALSIRQRKLEDFGNTIDKLVAAGANRVSGPDFRLEQSTEAENEARMKAIADGRSRAELYAAAAGMTVTRIIMIDEGRTSGLSSRGGGSDFAFAEASIYNMYDEPTPISAGELTVTSKIGMMFELAPK